jgi:hypothetical protein
MEQRPSTDLKEELSRPSRFFDSSTFFAELKLIGRDEFSGTERTRVALNSGLQRAWDQENPVSWILAKARCEILRLAPHEYSAKMKGLSHSTLSHLENHRDFASARYNPETIHRVIRGWERLARTKQYRHVKPEIDQAISDLLDCLTFDQKTPLFQLLMRWRYRLGPRAFDTATGLNYKQLWARGNTGVVSPFREILDHGRRLSLIPSKGTLVELNGNPFFQEARDAWTQDSLRLGRKPPLIDLHVFMDCGGLEVDAHSLRSRGVVIQTRTVEAIRNFRMCPWNKVKRLCMFLCEKGVISDDDLSHLRSSWQSHWSTRTASFEDKLWRKLQQSSLDTRRIAEVMGIGTDDVYKPSLPVFRAIKYGEGSKWIASGTLAHILVANDRERERLLNQKRDELSYARNVRGSGIDSPVAIERELWALKYEDLPYDKRAIQDLEWGRASELDEYEVLNAVRLEGERQANRAVEALESRNEAHTVRQLIENLLFHNGIAKLEGQLNTSQRLLRSIGAGEEVPSLNRIREFAEKGGFEVSERLEQDWRSVNARMGAVLASSPIERVLIAHMREEFDSRRQLFSKTKARPQMHRLVLGLYDSATILSGDVASFLRAYGIDARDERAYFLKHVIKSSSMVCGIAKWLETTNHEAARRLVQLSNTDDGSDKQGKEMALCYQEVLRVLPGVTLDELRAALKSQQDPVLLLYKKSIKKLLAKGLTETELLYAAVGGAKRDRVPLEMIARGLKKRQPMPVLPLGVVVSLAHSDSGDREEALAKARTVVQDVLELEGSPTSELCVEKRLWGIRLADLVGGQKALQSAVWSDSQQESGELRAQIARLQADMVKRTYERLLYIQSARHSAEFVEIASQIMPAGVRDVIQRARLSFRQPDLIKEGNFQVSLDQYQILGRLAGFKEESLLEWHWSLESAESIARVEGSALRRILFSHVLAQYEATGGGRVKSSRDSVAWRDFSKRCGLTPTKIKNIVDAALAKKTLSDGQAWTTVAKVCVPSAPDQFQHLLSYSITRQSLTHAVAAWLWSNQDDEVLLNDWRALVNRAVCYRARDAEGGSFVASSNQSALSQGEIALMRLLRGLTTKEFVAIGEALEKALESRNNARNVSQRGLSESVWCPKSEDLRTSVDTRVKLLASKLSDNYRVSDEALRELLPEMGSALGYLQGSLGSEVAWYIASLSFYSDLSGALTVMTDRIRSGMLPKHPGRKHYDLHRKWLQKRGSLGALNAQSMGLYFGYPYRQPKMQ